MDFQTIYNEAREAGLKAGNGHKPAPMIVGEAKSLFGNEIDHSKLTYYVSEGVCGFAWVIVKPGNSSFANWLKKNNLARSDSYYGGVSIWVSDFGQSYERKAEYAAAFAEVLRKHGIKASAYDRLD